MGIFGRAIGAALGGGIGSFFGKAGGGADVGATVGSWLPFNEGGRVKKMQRGGLIRPIPTAHREGAYRPVGQPVQAMKAGGLVVGRDAFGNVRVARQKK